MKKKLIITVSVVLVAIIGITVAQTVISKKTHRLSAEERAQLQTKKMTDIYNLSEDQQKEIYLVNLDFQKKVLELNQDKSDNNTKKTSESYLRDEHEKMVLPLLNEAQKVKWNEHKEYRKKNPKKEISK